MKTRTAAFDPAWANIRTRKRIYKVTYKRRYWNGSAFVLESVAKTIPAREIDKITGIRDTVGGKRQEQIKSSNVTLVLRNNTYKWLPSNTATGIWRIDATAAVGYEPIGSEFTIWAGFRTADDGDGGVTDEDLSMFVGRIADNLKFSSKGGVVTIPLVGLAEAKLEAADAQKVGTFIDDQATDPATGTAGGLLLFSTQKKSLWRVRTGTLRVDGVVKTQGTHFELNDLNDAEVNAEIEFTAGNAPGNGLAVLYDGDQWLRDKSIKELVEALCEAAGITSAYREIEEPVFSGVDQSNTYTAQADWEAGTGHGSGNGISTKAIPGAIIQTSGNDDFSDGDHTASPAWTVSAGAPTVSGGKLVATDGDEIYLASTAAYGTWQWKQKATGGGPSNGSFVKFIGNAGQTDYYGIIFEVATGNFYLAKVVGGAPTILAGTTADFSTEKIVRVKRSAAGAFTVFVGADEDSLVQVLSASDTAITTSARFQIGITSDTGTLTFEFDELAISDASSSGTWTAAELDMLAAPTSWLPAEIDGDANSGTITLKTDVASVSGGPDDGPATADGTNTPTSALKRYVKVILVLTGDAVVRSVTLRWRGSSLFIKSADFTGLTCMRAIDELAAMGGMERITKGDGTFVFRNKDVSGAADMILSQKNALLEVTDYQNGTKEVSNIAQVRYGKSGDKGYYFAEYKASDAAEASPTTAEKYGERVISLDLQRFIFSNEAAVADAIARKLYEQNYRPKRRLKVRARLIPQLDTGDKVQISFHDSPLIEKAIFGDPMQTYPVTGANARTLARDILMKVVGTSPDIIKGESLLDLEEVFS